MIKVSESSSFSMISPSSCSSVTLEDSQEVLPVVSVVITVSSFSYGMYIGVEQCWSLRLLDSRARASSLECELIGIVPYCVNPTLLLQHDASNELWCEDRLPHDRRRKLRIVGCHRGADCQQKYQRILWVGAQCWNYLLVSGLLTARVKVLTEPSRIRTAQSSEDTVIQNTER